MPFFLDTILHLPPEVTDMACRRSAVLLMLETWAERDTCRFLDALEPYLGCAGEGRHFLIGATEGMVGNERALRLLKMLTFRSDLSDEDLVYLSGCLYILGGAEGTRLLEDLRSRVPPHRERGRAWIDHWLVGDKAQDLASHLEAADEDATAVSLARDLGALIRRYTREFGAVPNDPRSDSPEVEYLVWPISRATESALGSTSGARQGIVLAHEGIVPAMLTASDRHLLAQLFLLLEAALARYEEVAGPATEASEDAARALESRTDLDLKPYAQRLRERFAK